MEFDSRVIGLVPQERKQDSLASGFLNRLLSGLNGHENRIDLRQDLRVVERQHPSSVARVIVVEDAQASDRLFGTQPFTPHVKRHFGFQFPRVRQVVRIKDEGLPFRVEDPAKGPLALAVSVPVMHVDDVEIACDHEVAYVTSLLSEFLLFSQSCGCVGNLFSKFTKLGLLESKRRIARVLFGLRLFYLRLKLRDANVPLGSLRLSDYTSLLCFGEARI